MTDNLFVMNRDFVERYYIDLKKANPKTPILIRECSGILPKIHARHGIFQFQFLVIKLSLKLSSNLHLEKGFEVSAAVTDMPADKVATVLGNLVQK